MIVDGLDGADALFGPKELHKYLPQSKYGSIVFTTRNKQLVHELIPLEERLIQLNRLSTEDALSFLQTRLGNLEEKRKPMLELIDLLEGLPLALSQASSFISRNSYNIDQYVRLYRRSDTTKIELLNNGGSRLDGSLSNPVTKTWQISFENIRDKSSLAARILSFGACLHPQRIPLNLLPSSESPVEVVDALGLLRAYSMVTSNASDDSITMHSLVHLVTRHRLRSEAQLEEYVQMSFDSVYHNFPERFERQEELLDGDQYSLHVQTVLDNGLLTAQGPRRCHVLLASRTSHYFRGKGEYDISLRYAKMATDWCHLASSKEDACTMSRINDLAVANWYHGDYKEAETAAREVLDLRKQVLGHEHKDTLATLNNLGLILHAQGKYETAEEIHQRALEIREKTLGANHNETLKSLNNLGLSLKRQQKYVEAEKAFRRVSIERRAMFGTAHVSTLVPLNNLGLVLELRERHEEAFAVHSEVLCAREALHGTGHPETLKSKQNMAVVLRKQGQLERADIMMREVLAKYVQALGEKHPDVLYAMSSLATLHQERGKYQDAEDLSRQVFQTRRDQLGENHPDAIFSENQWKEVRKKNFENTNATLELD
ncbi:TPR-like protein [Viridothelium virens]|uniref:TPR-like protein n=1 Tax=Viridothelium virens TaxID=1048519 RepID=A0A6A6H9Y0_VIRVR|nr:TPR-like protein [Viridothelium virens]